MKLFLKKYWHYIFLFFFFFFVLQFTFSVTTSDAIWNYGFSYAISMGEVPYRDFNMIVPPFSAFFYVIPLLVSKSYVVYNIFQSLLIVFLFVLLEKMYSKNVYFLLFLLIFPFPNFFLAVIFPGYNFLLLLLFVCLLWCEEHNVNDYIVGVLLAFLILTKQSVGIFLCFPMLYFWKRTREKIGKRVIACISVFLCVIFYLLVTGSFYDFIDQCFLGLFDFQQKNGNLFFTNVFFWIWIGLILIILYWLKTKKANLLLYYLLAFSVVSYPLFDYYHVALFLFCFSFLILFHIRKIIISGVIPICLCSSLFLYFLFFGAIHHFKVPNVVSFPGFELMKVSENREAEISLLNSFISRHQDDNLIFLTNDAYFFKITNRLFITHYDLINYGNHGYRGTERIISKLKKEKQPIIILSAREYQNVTSSDQLNIELIDYVLKNYKQVERIGTYEVYQKVS